MWHEGGAHYPVWHPYTQMQLEPEPVFIVSGKGACVFDRDGNRYIDAVASWWTNIHGHAHPYIARKIYEQSLQLEQVIFAGFTHKPAVELAEKLLRYIPFHAKVFYSDNGSSAVEAALKMALQFFANQGSPRNKIIAFRDAYHGDTFGSMSVSARNVFTAPFQHHLFEVIFVDTPVKGHEEKSLRQMQEALEQYGAQMAAFIYEPLVLGSAGMLLYRAETLDAMMALCRSYGVLTIADEVMTGFGRTGKFLATEYCVHRPDIICLSKGITGGFLPFAATTCTQKIYEAFLSADKAKMLFHGHSYTANPLGCAAALASLELFDREQTMHRIAAISDRHAVFADRIRPLAQVKEVRHLGTVLAVEINTAGASGYLNSLRDAAWRFFMERKIILRPLGNVVYVLPPYCISDDELTEVYRAILDFLSYIRNSGYAAPAVDFT